VTSTNACTSFNMLLSGPPRVDYLAQYPYIGCSDVSSPQICINILQMPYLLFNMYHLM